VVLAQAPDAVGQIVAELDLDSQRRIRASLPSLANRRPEAYRWPEGGGEETPDPDRASAHGAPA
jgi:hypothetical protein